ncbi:MAG: hypothetical protein JW974_00805 [Alphaproteobacteria bacterium]|nr:hypothetical protein [Alphaproteobacteria bacterium]MBN2674982.1 hypothetical protein [Alphaproteobacteria bacterium]
MNKLFAFILCAFISIGFANAAERSDNSITRQKNTIQQTSVQRSTIAQKTSDRTARSASNNTQAREILNRDNLASRTTESTTNKRGTTARTATNQKTKITVVRASVDSTAISETRTGAEYEQCKNAYFTCMDQFCTLKNDDYRRCSCSDRIYELSDVKTVMQDANDKLTAFTENLDSVSMTAAQANAMKTSSEGENSLTSDGSSSKALLQAIMNSIRGEDTNVGGKFSDLNSINLSFDTANSFGTMDAGQAVAAYNGKNLYTAVYSQCRTAVKPDCNNASLQRAVTAYLMAIEQDCNTVETSINENKKKMTAAVREGNAMLDLARVENRQNHNSDDMTACMNNVEKAVLNEEVCGTGYHKCLDNGEFIDISTGAPIAGVVKFYELEGLLKFNESSNVADQKLSKVSNNRVFVQNFENRVKKFAQQALDKCTEDADTVWSDYLDKAMLDIYYAQKAKVTEIKQGCFDFVSSCYVNGDNALTAAMKELLGDTSVILQPDKITLNSAVCKEYVESCDNMFDGNIVKQYIESRKDTDTLSACRAVVKQCFDKFGGTNYENFYYPSSGLFSIGEAVKWFSLCDGVNCTNYISECAKQLSKIDSCSSKDMMTKAFGGLDYMPDEDGKYGLIKDDNTWGKRAIRPSGVATEIYYQIIDTLSTQCNNLQGRFVELQFLKTDMYNDPDNICLSSFRSSTNGEYYTLASLYGVGNGEDMCPRDYNLAVDTQSWGACLCWENGARRSEWGTNVKCVAKIPTTSADGIACGNATGSGLINPPVSTGTVNWCIQGILSSTNQVCPFKATGTANGICIWGNGTSTEYILNISRIPEGIL